MATSTRVGASLFQDADATGDEKMKLSVAAVAPVQQISGTRHAAKIFPRLANLTDMGSRGCSWGQDCRICFSLPDSIGGFRENMNSAVALPRWQTVDGPSGISPNDRQRV